MPTHPMQGIFAVVLAAGQASRFGATKQLLDWQGQAMVARAVSTARAVCADNVLVVLGHDSQAVSQALSHERCFLLLNEQYREGIGSSIAAAARALHTVADAMLILLADQPLLQPADLAAIIDAWPGQDHCIVASEYAGSRGAPVLFGRAAFSELMQLQGDSGARRVMQSERFALQSLPCDNAAYDVDTAADFEQRSQLTQPESPSA